MYAIIIDNKMIELSITRTKPVWSESEFMIIQYKKFLEKSYSEVIFELFDNFTEFNENLQFNISNITKVIPAAISDYKLRLIHDTRETVFAIAPDYTIEMLLSKYLTDDKICELINNLSHEISRMIILFIRFVKRKELITPLKKLIFYLVNRDIKLDKMGYIIRFFPNHICTVK